MVENIITLLMLILLQAVLGFDNLLYISIESKRAPKEKQSMVRKLGISLAIILRIGLLFLLVNVMSAFKEPFEWLTLNTDWLSFEFNLSSIITLFGGVFIIYTAIKEIWHMMSIKLGEDHGKGNKGSSVGKVVALIVIMNVVFSFDSILSAMALTEVFWIMATAIVISGILMIVLAEKVSTFLEKNRMYEVLGLFILFIVGIMLVTEGGEKAALTIFGNAVEHMEKTTFYFVIFILVIIDIVQSRYQKKLLLEKERAKKLIEQDEGIA